jgi:glutamate dehydrogenase
MITALGLPEDATKMTPAELLRHILLAPVDLLWNGGIGTYVKSSQEENGSVGDRANDAIRVNGDELRVKVIGEGGNLGLTQLGRIEAALNKVRVNTDAIDNSAGVDTSDHEVNIKILLGQLVRDGDMTMKQRNKLLSSMTDEVARQVLRDNYEQNVLLGNARAQEASMLPVHERFMHWLEERGELDRSLEFLPTDSELGARADRGLGLKSPEFSVLVAYAKLALKDDLLPSDLPDDPWFRETLTDYFPEPIREKFAGELEAHPLRREIITNAVANSIINRGGITFAFRAMEETGATPVQIARAFVICREVFNLSDYVRTVELLDNVVSTETQTALYLEFRRLLDRSVRWFLASRPSTLDVASEVERFRPTVAEHGPRIAELLEGTELERFQRNVTGLERKGVPEDMAVRAAGLLDQFSLLDIVDICQDTDEEPTDVAPLYFRLSETFRIDSMLTKVTRLPRDDRWDALARGALRDDLYTVLESLVRSVLEATPEADGMSASQRYEVWAESNNDALDRMRRALQGVERLDSPNIAALSVALRTLRSVIKSGSATA